MKRKKGDTENRVHRKKGATEKKKKDDSRGGKGGRDQYGGLRDLC